MASNPFPDKRRRQWAMKYRPDPAGPWVRVTLCKPIEGRMGRKAPQEVLDRARDFAEIEYRARHGLATAPARARGLAAYLECYAESQSLSARPSSNRILRRQVRNFIAFADRTGIASVQAVTRAHCRAYMEERIRVVAHATLRVERGYLIGAWTRAVEDGLMAANPWAGVAIPGKPTEVETTYWSDEEVARIAAACARPWQSDLVLALAATGLRISTALAMRWGWVDWGRGTIRVPAGVEDVKTAYETSMGRAARDLLTRRYATSGGSDFAFPHPADGGRPVGYDTAASAIMRAIRKSGVRRGTPHDLRHSYARGLVARGVPITVVSRQLGHASLTMTQRYVSADAESTRHFLDLADGPEGPAG